MTKVDFKFKGSEYSWFFYHSIGCESSEGSVGQFIDLSIMEVYHKIKPNGTSSDISLYIIVTWSAVFRDRIFCVNIDSFQWYTIWNRNVEHLLIHFRFQLKRISVLQPTHDTLY